MLISKLRNMLSKVKLNQATSALRFRFKYEFANRITAAFLVCLIYTLLYSLQPGPNGGLNTPKPIPNSVLYFPNYCSSPHNLFKRHDVLPVLLSPLFAPNILLLTLHQIGIGILWLVFFRDAKRSSLKFCGLFVIVTYGLRFLVSLLLFHYYTRFFDLDLVAISHLYHECSSGISVLLIPVYVWTFDNPPSNFQQLKSRKRLLVPIVLLTNILEIRVYYPNSLTNILTLIVAVFLLPFFFHSSVSEPEFQFPRNNNVVRLKLSRYSHHNYTKKLLSNKWILISSICLLLTAHSTNLEEIGRSSRKGASLAIAISTVPRPGNPTYLIRTIEALLEQISTNGGTLPSRRVDIYVLSFNTQPETDLVFNATRLLYGTYSNPNVSISFLSGNEAISSLNTTVTGNTGTFLRLNYNFAASLMTAFTNSEDADYILLHEDDFPICPNAWIWIRDVISLATEHNGCGVFLATGGAGLVIRRNVVPQVVSLLLDRNASDPADVKIQNCLRGVYPEHCDKCSGRSLLIASHLVFGHIGFVSSLNHNYVKAERRWACGWRHAFNGDPDVTVLHTDRNVLF